jgi:ABC-2 type transport system permease protein
LLDSIDSRSTADRRPIAKKGSTLAAIPDVAVRTSEPPRLHPIARFRELSAAREILGNLTRKEVKVKYKSSVLGVAWSMLNPVLYLAVFSLVFAVVLRNDVPHFPVYLLSGLLAWNLFSTSLTLAARSVVDNSNLVTKVYFPREILPLASVGAACVDFLLQMVVLAAFLVVFRYNFTGLNLLLLPLSVFTLLVFTSAMALWVSALNVRYRDIQHLLNVGLLAWFWLTPVVYPSGFVYERFVAKGIGGVSLFKLFLANPLTPIVMGFQRALYRTTVVTVDGHQVTILPPVSLPWLVGLIGAVAVGSLVLLALAWRTFFHMSGDFAEEL